MRRFVTGVHPKTRQLVTVAYWWVDGGNAIMVTRGTTKYIAGMPDDSEVVLKLGITSGCVQRVFEIFLKRYAGMCSCGQPMDYNKYQCEDCRFRSS